MSADANHTFTVGNALTDNLLPDLGLNQNDYNNVRYIARVQDHIYSHVPGHYSATYLLPAR
jgi:hypothetical protein